MGGDVEEKVELEGVAVGHVSPIADPLIDGKLLERALKLVRKAHSEKSVKRGVPTIQKAIRKGGKGLVLLAADVHPVEVYAHIPIICEENSIQYAYVPSRSALGQACNSMRFCSALMVDKPDKEKEYAKTFEQVKEGVAAVNSYTS